MQQQLTHSETLTVMFCCHKPGPLSINESKLDSALYRRWDSAFESVTTTLCSWCSFRLLEDTFVRVLERSGTSPASFCLVRCMRQDAYAIIWIGFVMMAPTERLRIGDSLRQALSINEVLETVTTVEPEGPIADSEEPGGATTAVKSPEPPELTGQWQCKIVVLSTLSSSYYPQYMKLLANPMTEHKSRVIPENLSSYTSHLSKTRWSWYADMDRASLPLTHSECDEILAEFNSTLVHWMHYSRMNQGFIVTSSTDEITTFTFEMAMDPLEDEMADGQPTSTCLVQCAVIPSDGQDCVKSEVWIGPSSGTVAELSSRTFSGKSWKEIAEVILTQDIRFATVLITFKYLVSLCGHVLLNRSENDDDEVLIVAPMPEPTEEVLMQNQIEINASTATDTEIPILISGRFDRVARIPFDISVLLRAAERTVLRYPGFSSRSSCFCHVGHEQTDCADDHSSWPIDGEPCACLASMFEEAFAQNIRASSDVEIVLNDADHKSISNEIHGDYPQHTKFRCFAKLDISSAEACLIVTLLPVSSVQSSAIFDVIVLECTREMINCPPEQSMNTEVKVDHSTSTLVDLQSTLSAECHTASEAHELFLRTCFLRCYIETVFLQLQDGHHVSPPEMQNVLDVCTQMESEIEITDLLGKLNASSARDVAEGMDPVSHKEDIRARFRSVLEQHFLQIGHESLPWVIRSDLSEEKPAAATVDTLDASAASRFSFSPPSFGHFEPTINSSFDYNSDTSSIFDDQVGEDPTDDSEQSIPIFLIVECSIRRKAKSGSNFYYTKPVRTVPVSLWELVDCLSRDGDGLMEALAEGNVSVLLHLEVFTMPELEMHPDDDDLTGRWDSLDTHSRASSYGSSVIDIIPSYPASLSDGRTRSRTSSLVSGLGYAGSLGDLGEPAPPVSAAQIYGAKVMDQLSSRIHWLLEDELISLQRQEEKVSLAILRRCVDHMDAVQPIETPSRIELVPLEFVGGDWSNTIKMLAKELTFEALLGHSAVTFGEFTCILPIASGPNSLASGSTVFMKPMPPVPSKFVEVPFALPNLFNDDENESVFEYLPAFYLVVIVSGIRNITVLLHTRSTNPIYELQLMDAVCHIARNSVQKVNELLLLENVDETKLCSPMLVVPPGMATTISGQISPRADLDLLAGPASFADGYFSCRLVFEREFGLFCGLTAADAITAINRALPMFNVQNRTDQFVYREQHTRAVFLLHFVAKTSEQDLPARDPPRSRAESDSSTRDSEIDRIPERVDLQVFGVRNVSSGIGKDLVDMLCSVIDNATLALLSGKLARKATLRLLPSEVTFLQQEGCSEDVTLPIPRIVSRPSGFLNFFCQALHQYLLPYFGPPLTRRETADSNPAPPLPADEEGVAEDWFTSTSFSAVTSPPPPSPTASPDVIMEDTSASFIYNHTESRQRHKMRDQQLFKDRFSRRGGGGGGGGGGDKKNNDSLRETMAVAIGTGTALIHITTEPGNNPPDPDQTPSLTQALEYMRSPEHYAKAWKQGTDDAGGPMVRIRIWGRGALKRHTLAECIALSGKQALTDSIIETVLVRNSLLVGSPKQASPDASASAGVIETLSATHGHRTVDTIGVTSGSYREDPHLDLDLAECLLRVGICEDVTDLSSIGIQSFTTTKGRAPAILDHIPGMIKGLSSRMKLACFRSSTKRQLPPRGLPSESSENALEWHLKDERFVPFKSEDLSSEHKVATRSPPAFGERTQRNGCIHGHPVMFVGSNVEGWDPSAAIAPSAAATSPEPAAAVAKSKSPKLPKSIRPNSSGSDLTMFKSLSGKASERHCFVMVLAKNERIDVVTYNLQDRACKDFLLMISSMVQWGNCRTQFLNHVLHTKMGLFRHAPLVTASSPREIGSIQLRCQSIAELRLLLDFSVVPTRKERQAIPRAAKTKQNVVALLEGQQPKATMDTCIYHNEVDPVRRHGMQLNTVATAHRQADNFNMGMRLLAQMWQSRHKYTSLPPLAQRIHIDQVLAVRRSMRIVHYCATPVLYLPDETASSRDRGPSQVLKDDSLQGITDEAGKEWRVRLMEDFRKLYVQYTVSKKMNFVEVVTSTLDGDQSDGKFHRTTYCQYQRGFMRGGGLIIFEVGFIGSFACIKLHTLNTPSRPQGDEDGEFGPDEAEVSEGITDVHERGDLFSEDCAQFKDFMHVNSFGYDFNLFTLISMLKKRKLPYPSFDFWNTLSSLETLFPKIPKYRHNYLSRGAIDLRRLTGKSGLRLVSASSVLELLHKNADDYGMTAMEQQSGLKFLWSNACTKSRSENITVTVLFSSALVGNAASDGDADPGQVEHKVPYYIVLCDHENRFPRRSLQSAGGDKMAGVEAMMAIRKRLGYSALAEPTPFEPATTSFAKLASEVDDWVLNMLYQALEHHRRDRLWAVLLDSDPPINGMDELRSLLHCSFVEAFDEIDADTIELFKLEIQWDPLVRKLAHIYGDRVRLIATGTAGKVVVNQQHDPSVHVIIVAANHDDIAAHVFYDPAGSRARVAMLCRVSPYLQPASASPTSASGGNTGGDGDDDDDDVIVPERLQEMRAHMSAIVNSFCVHHWATL